MLCRFVPQVVLSVILRWDFYFKDNKSARFSSFAGTLERDPTRTVSGQLFIYLIRVSSNVRKGQRGGVGQLLLTLTRYFIVRVLF